MVAADALEEAKGMARFMHFNQDVHVHAKHSAYVNKIHAHAEKFDTRTEEALKYVQVRSRGVSTTTACWCKLALFDPVSSRIPLV